MKKILIWFVLIAIVMGSFLVYWMYYNTYSDGNRSGLLQKFSHKGNIFKTYEGELIMSSITGSRSSVIASEKFFFSVDNDSIANLLNNLEGHFVTLHYLQKRRTLPWRGESKYIIDGVEESEDMRY